MSLKSDPFDPDAALERFERAWSPETSVRFTPANPARGHCGVTALVVQVVHGGTIEQTVVDGETHFYNRLDGERHDLTVGQFDELPAYHDVRVSRETALADTTVDQYATLLRRYRAELR